MLSTGFCGSAGSLFHLVLREYNLDIYDLSIKVPGGAMSVKRWYYDSQWHWEHTRNNLKFKWDSLGQYIESIDKGGVIYKRTSSISQVFTHDVYKITPKEMGYRWEDKRGSWKEYDENGRMTSYGRRSGVIGNFLYDQGENGKLIGITDRDDNQVIWFEYDGDGLISAVHDNENRRVEYTSTNGLLTKVTDVGERGTLVKY